jgi:hypothetical protein
MTIDLRRTDEAARDRARVLKTLPARSPRPGGPFRFAAKLGMIDPNRPTTHLEIDAKKQS